MKQDKKLILEICKKNEEALREECAACEQNVVADEKEGKSFSEKGIELFSEPIDLSYSQQEIQEAINEQHYELTEEDINALKNN